MNKIKFWILFITQFILVPLIIIGFIVIYIYAFIAYGDKPITEIPSWIFWLVKG